MRLPVVREKKIKAEVKQIVSQHLNLKDYRVFLFGSRVNNRGDERSDIDIGILGPEVVPLATMGVIREELNNLPTLLNFDLVDFTNVSNEFKNFALKEAEII